MSAVFTAANLFGTIDYAGVLAYIERDVPEFPFSTQEVPEFSASPAVVLATEIANGTNLPEILPTETPDLPEYVYVKTGVEDGNLNLRAGPGLEFRVLLVLPEGSQAIYLANSGRGCINNWVNIKYAGLVGFVDGAYLVDNPCQ